MVWLRIFWVCVAMLMFYIAWFVGGLVLDPLDASAGAGFQELFPKILGIIIVIAAAIGGLAFVSFAVFTRSPNPSWETPESGSSAPSSRQAKETEERQWARRVCARIYEEAESSPQSPK